MMKQYRAGYIACSEDEGNPPARAPRTQGQTFHSGTEGGNAPLCDKYDNFFVNRIFFRKCSNYAKIKSDKAQSLG